MNAGVPFAFSFFTEPGALATGKRGLPTLNAVLPASINQDLDIPSPTCPKVYFLGLSKSKPVEQED